LPVKERTNEREKGRKKALRLFDLYEKYLPLHFYFLYLRNERRSVLWDEIDEWVVSLSFSFFLTPLHTVLSHTRYRTTLPDAFISSLPSKKKSLSRVCDVNHR
jgi:hypothetical protein